MSLSSSLRHIRWRVLFFSFACVLAFLLAPLIVGFANYGSKLSGDAAPVDRPAYTSQLPSPTYDPAKRIAVIMASLSGPEITDVLPTFEILARSGTFNVYIVAPERTVLHFINSGADGDTGLDFVPHFSYAGYATAIGKNPDLIAIPYLGHTSVSDPAVLDWVRAHAGPTTTLLGICVGSSILANTGLLDGHKATTNTYWLDRTALEHPQVQVIRGVRYVDDGPAITSTNLASGVDATLHTVSRLVGRSVAEDVAHQLGYSHTAYLDDPTFHAPTQSAFPVPLVEDQMFEWHREQLGVLLADGVSEMALAALLDPYTASFAAQPRLFAAQRTPIVSRDGLVLLPRYDFSTVPALDRVVVPGGDATAARQQAIAAWEWLHPNRPVQDIHRAVGQGESAYEATLRDLARSHNGMIALPIANALFVPTDSLRLTDARWPIEPIGAHLALGLLGVGLVFALRRVPLRRRAPVPAMKGV
jgi:AraC family transcriptional regulator, transcriptional activator FtrA